MKKIIFVCVTIVLFMSTYSATGEAQVTFVGNGQQLNNFVGRGVALADLDRDGDLDFVLVTQQEPFARIYLNDGKGRFADVWLNASQIKRPSFAIHHQGYPFLFEADNVPPV